jgi:hypothetical protein
MDERTGGRTARVGVFIATPEPRTLSPAPISRTWLAATRHRQINFAPLGLRRRRCRVKIRARPVPKRCGNVPLSRRRLHKRSRSVQRSSRRVCRSIRRLQRSSRRAHGSRRGEAREITGRITGRHVTPLRSPAPYPRPSIFKHALARAGLRQCRNAGFSWRHPRRDHAPPALIVFREPCRTHPSETAPKNFLLRAAA